MTYHEELVKSICARGLTLLKLPHLRFRPMQRKNNQVDTKRGFIIGQTNLKTGLITIDIWTPKFRKAKTLASILRTLAHEAAHYQKPPYRQYYRGRWIIRRHYPKFYQQVSKNILIFKRDKILHNYFL